MKSEKKPQNTIMIFRRLMHYFREYKFRLGLVLLCMIVSSVCSVRGTYYLKPAINEYILPLIGQEDPDLTGFLAILFRMAVLYGLSVLGSLLQAVIMVRISNRVMYKVRTDMYDRMQKLPMTYFDTHGTGRIMNYYNSDVDALSNMLRQSFPKIVEGLVTCITVFVTIFRVNFLLALAVVLCETALVLLLKTLVKRNRKHFSDQQKELEILNDYTEESISGQNVVQAFGREEAVLRQFDSCNDRLCASANQADFYADSIFCITSGASYLGFTLLAVTGGMMALGGLADVGTVGVFLQYYRNLYNPMTNISKQFNNLLSALAGAERIFDFLDLPEETDAGTVRLIRKASGYAWEITGEDGQITCRPFAGRLRFEHVDFGYRPDQLVLKDFDLSVEPGQKVAFVGSTGAGKTTVTNLLSRFYEIRSGRILVDSIDIETIRRDSLRSMIVMVLQDTHLFTGTIGENIRFGNPEASPEEIQSAARLASAEHFISRQSAGYDTLLTHDGASLSQGQRQLLAIARAAVSHAPVLILDEATSSIDTRTEKLIEKGFDSLMLGRTVLVIAHRLSTIQNADMIVVLDHGQIMEKGSHEQLLAMRGQYYRLCSGLSELD